MYQLISAIAKNIEDDTRWHNVDIGNMPMSTIFATFSRVTATLSNPFLTHNVSLDLALIRSTTGGLSTTFNDFLTANGQKTLPTTDDLPVINTRYAKYADVFHAGFTVKPVSPGRSPDAELPPSEKTDLYIQKDSTTNPVDYNAMYTYALPVVNGFIHASDSDANGFYVKDGMKSQMLSGCNLMGLISFREVGTFKIIPIKLEMLYRQNDRQSFRNQCFIDTGVDISQKVILLVLGGYMHVVDEQTMYRVSDTAFGVNFNNIPLLDRYYDSKDFIDLTSMNVENSTRNENQIAIQSLFSDEAIAAYCTLSQSFVVVLDKADLFVDRLNLDDNGGPGMYRTTELPIWPMVGPYGRLLNYWYKADDVVQNEAGDDVTIFSVTAYNTSVYRRLYDTVNPRVQNSVTDGNDSYKPSRNSIAQFIRIGTDI